MLVTSLWFTGGSAKASVTLFFYKNYYMRNFSSFVLLRRRDLRPPVRPSREFFVETYFSFSSEQHLRKYYLRHTGGSTTRLQFSWLLIGSLIGKSPVDVMF